MNKIKSPTPLNLPSNKDQFEDVSFVNGMSEYSLKVLIKRLWLNLMSLANAFDGRRDDVPKIIDKILNAQKWTEKDISDRYYYGLYSDFIIKYDTLDNLFTLLDINTSIPISEPFKAVTITEAKINAKIAIKNNAF